VAQTAQAVLLVQTVALELLQVQVQVEQTAQAEHLAMQEHQELMEALELQGHQEQVEQVQRMV